MERFPAISLAYRALRTGGTLPAAMNAANEVAVEAFINGHISFNDIPRVIKRVMDGHEVEAVSNLDVVLRTDAEARSQALAAINRLSASAPTFAGD
jgi:1-deoxy-D-xylulose-5-phosphate reductoisomerase